MKSLHMLPSLRLKLRFIQGKLTYITYSRKSKSRCPKLGSNAITNSGVRVKYLPAFHGTFLQIWHQLFLFKRPFIIRCDIAFWRKNSLPALHSFLFETIFQTSKTNGVERPIEFLFVFEKTGKEIWCDDWCRGFFVLHLAKKNLCQSSLSGTHNNSILF